MFRQRFKAKDGSEPDKRKIKSSKVEQDGIVFDSKLENYFYNLLKENNIPFLLKQSFELVPTFRYRHETVLAMKVTPDYILPDHNLIVDTKGFGNETVPLRYKMLKYMLHTQGTEYQIEMPSSQKACRAIIEQLKTGWVLSEPLTESAATRRKNNLKKEGWIWESGMWLKAFKDKYNDGTIVDGTAVYNAERIMKLRHYDFEELLLKHK